MVAHTFGLSPRQVELKFEASLVYTSSFKTAKATDRNPVWRE